MNENELKKQMDEFYKLDTSMEHANVSAQVNEYMKSMEKEQMGESFGRFGLLPVETYLDKEDGNNQGFIRYVDAYLVEQSGGKRETLLSVGKQLTGKDIQMFSMRLIRVAIISAYMAKL